MPRTCPLPVDLVTMTANMAQVFVADWCGVDLGVHAALSPPGRGDRVLAAAGYLVEEVRQAPDRPGRELVFIARRADVSSTGT